jgi:hypothetical protein
MTPEGGLNMPGPDLNIPAGSGIAVLFGAER